MDETPTAEEIAAARAYEALHVPALFREWPPHVLDAARVGVGQRVLDVACGTGVLAREAAHRVVPGGVVTGIDPAPGMLAVARELAPTVRWLQGPAEALPVFDHAFDAVVSQFGLMFFSDRDASMREMFRALKPGGRLAAAVWDGLERSEAYRDEVALLERRAGDRAADALRAPFVLGDAAEVCALVERAGGIDVECVTLAGTARFPSVRAMVAADLRGWLPIMGVHLDEPLVAAILHEAEQVLGRFVVEDGTVVFENRAHIVTARCP